MSIEEMIEKKPLTAAGVLVGTGSGAYLYNEKPLTAAGVLVGTGSGAYLHTFQKKEKSEEKKC